MGVLLGHRGPLDRRRVQRRGGRRLVGRRRGRRLVGERRRDRDGGRRRGDGGLRAGLRRAEGLQRGECDVYRSGHVRRGCRLRGRHHLRPDDEDVRPGRRLRRAGGEGRHRAAEHAARARSLLLDDGRGRKLDEMGDRGLCHQQDDDRLRDQDPLRPDAFSGPGHAELPAGRDPDPGRARQRDGHPDAAHECPRGRRSELPRTAPASRTSRRA